MIVFKTHHLLPLLCCLKLKHLSRRHGLKEHAVGSKELKRDGLSPSAFGLGLGAWSWCWYPAGVPLVNPLGMLD